MLPEWLNAENLRQASVVAMFVLAITGLIVWRVVRAIVTRMIFLAIIAGLIGALWIQRDEFEQCQRTCSCSIFGQDVNIPDAKLPSILDVGDAGVDVCQRAS